MITPSFANWYLKVSIMHHGYLRESFSNLIGSSNISYLYGFSCERESLKKIVALAEQKRIINFARYTWKRELAYKLELAFIWNDSP